MLVLSQTISSSGPASSFLAVVTSELPRKLYKIGQVCKTSIVFSQSPPILNSGIYCSGCGFYRRCIYITYVTPMDSQIWSHDCYPLRRDMCNGLGRYGQEPLLGCRRRRTDVFSGCWGSDGVEREQSWRRLRMGTSVPSRPCPCPAVSSELHPCPTHSPSLPLHL